jgi:oxidase EvaA
VSAPAFPDRVRTQRLAERFARSAAAGADGADDVAGWLAQRTKAGHYRVERVPFGELGGWEFDPGTGDLRHRSGRFFSVVGLRAAVDGTPPHSWHQPVIDQPEAGILGIVAKEFDGVLHFLMQAKMEPGNCNLVQLSPTVQATPSNYRRVHHGTGVKYLDYFVHPDTDSVLVDVLQSEHGAWFYRKRNRNMIVEPAGEVPVLDGFRWMTLGQIARLVRRDNAVGMDARTVLSCIPAVEEPGESLHADLQLRSWFTEVRSRRVLTTQRVPMGRLPGWVRDDYSIHRIDGRYFSIAAVSVQAGTREVSSWSQPLLEQHGLGVNAFLTARFRDVPHVLVHARVECGLVDDVELAPTVQVTPDNCPPHRRPRFLDRVLAAGPERIAFDALLSEEGGRLLNAQSRYMVVETDPFPAPPDFRWVTPVQLSALVQHSNYVNVQARTLLMCLNAMAVERALGVQGATAAYAA